MTVPRYDTQHVEKAPIAGVRVPTSVPIEAVAALPKVNISGVVKSADEMYQRELEKANQISVLGADAKAAALETDMLYNPQTGLLNMKGRDSLGARDKFQEQWKKGMDDIGKDLHNDTQRMAFQRSALNRYASVSDTISRHISNEIKNYDGEQTQSLIVNETNAAVAAAVPGVTVSDAADRSTMAIARQRAAILDRSRNEGWSPEKVQSVLEATTSGTHTSVLGRMLYNKDDLTAKHYFDEFKDQLVGDDLTKMGKAVEESSYLGESQRQSDQITAKFRDDREGAIEAVKKIADPRMRDAVEQRVVHEFEMKTALQREKENDLYQKATNLIEPLVKRGAPFIASNVVPRDVWSQLPLAARNALERRALHADSDYPNDPGKWHDFLDLTPKELGSLNRQEFETKYWQHFDRETRTRAEMQWATARDAMRTGKMDAKLSADETFKDLVKMSIQSVDPVYVKQPAAKWTPDQMQFHNDYTIEAMRRKEAAETAKGKPLTRAETQDVLDGLVKERVFVDKPFSHDPMKMPGEVSRDEKKRAYVPYESIPETVRNELGGMVPKGTPKRKLERLYAARLMNDPALFRAILAEK